MMLARGPRAIRWLSVGAQDCHVMPRRRSAWRLSSTNVGNCATLWNRYRESTNCRVH